ncbi:MAG: diaminopimelate epimerase [Candidatus Omnitrophota bacterium]|jgi:diaminopimelate epimerase
MNKISFTKMVASGNDFVVVRAGKRKPETGSPNNLARIVCDRKYGVGADGLLVLGKSGIADIKMRVFNADGSEAEMCGNGARCVALFIGRRCKKVETRAGIIETKVNKDKIKIKLTEPKKLKLNMPLTINGRLLKVNFINSGVPHTVIFAEGLEKIDIASLGRQIRFHQKFAPAGTNVNFVEVLDDNSLKVRTYERGVEDETLACGTGAVASALIFAVRYSLPAGLRVNVVTKSGETLRVYFEKSGNNFKNVWLEGKAKIVFRGELREE